VFIKLEYSQKIFEICLNIKLQANRPLEGELLPCGQTDGHADMTKLLVVFRNFANALKVIRNNILPTLLRKNLTTARSDQEGSQIHIFTNTKLQQIHLLYSASSPSFPREQQPADNRLVRLSSPLTAVADPRPL